MKYTHTGEHAQRKKTPIYDFLPVGESRLIGRFNPVVYIGEAQLKSDVNEIPIPTTLPLVCWSIALFTSHTWLIGVGLLL